MGHLPIWPAWTWKACKNFLAIKKEKNVGKDVENVSALLHCLQECKRGQPLWKTVWQLLQKLNTESPHDPAIPLLDGYPEELKCLNKSSHTDVHGSIVHNSQKVETKLRCPSSDKRINKMWSLHLVEYYLVMKRNEVLTQATM